ncbi:MAG: M6 family metalloprotease domain-containing protein [Candidatus Cloacimonetes bacterium]|nr:M6 family metalloprotease domain-containing protein [Candidatus Cloacimonadota bacterium]
MYKALLVLLALLLAATLPAALIRNQPMTITQPDGTAYDVFASGDEFFNYLHDEAGFTIIPDRDTDWYHYAERSGDDLIPGPWRVGEVEPEAAGLEPYTLISQSAYLARRNAWMDGVRDDSRIPDTGDVNNLVVYIRFADQSEFDLTREFYDQKFNDVTPGAESMYNYYNEVSYGEMFLYSYHFPVCDMTTNLSYQDSHSRGYFSPYSVGNPDGYQTDTERRLREHQLLADAVADIEGEVPLDLVIDGDSDGQVDNVCFIIRGGNDGWNDLLWAHRWVLWSFDVYLHGMLVYDYTFQPESQNSVGTLNHEMFHSLGAPDLYHYNGGPYSPVGPWDLMDGGDAHMCAYMKYRYSTWISDIPVISESGVYTLYPLLEADNNCYRINSPNSGSEYFVVEYRKYTPGTFEQNIPGSGLVIYRINGALHGQGNASGPPDEIYAYRPGGTNTSNGSPNQANFSYETGRTEFSDYTNPSCFLTNNGEGGIFIHQVGPAGDSITFILDPQVGFINGAVEAENPEANLSDVVITLEDQTFSPNSSGTFSVAYLQGAYPISATLIGYSTDVQEVTVPVGGNGEVNFYLEYLEPPTNLEYELGEQNGNTMPCTLTWDFPTGVEDFENFRVWINVFGYFSPIATPVDPIHEITLAMDRNYQFYVCAEYSNGESDSSNVVAVNFVGVEHEETPPAMTRLDGNVPNPFNPETTVSYELATASNVKLDVFDVRGRRVATLVTGNMPAGRHEALWQGRDTQGHAVSSGVYFYRLTVNGCTVATRKMLLLK